MKQTFYKAFDAIPGSLERCFLRSDFDVVKHIQKFIVYSANNIRSSKKDITQRLQHFKSLISFDVLEEELAGLKFHSYLTKRVLRLRKK